ncbi:MAG: AAA family ATPase [Cyanobacteria bacterium]|nr:AAA family ATPase [Cyanobacteriota bacterium]MDW8199614.1 AAA family ATPase [Cyanobacteriota bacterium SKYGB_h_bin112]
MSRVIALFNQAGGVGKSSVTMNLGYSLAQHDRRVLLVDLDPQASLTLFMGLEPSELQQTIYESLLEDKELAIHSNLHGMDLVPANIRLSGAELELVTADMRDLRLKEALRPAQKHYDFILVDCPPSLGILSYISLVAAHYVLVPIQTQYKAFCGTEMLLSTVARVRSRANRTLKIAGFIPTMYTARNSQDVRALEAIQQQMAEFGTVFAPIVRATAFADAAEAHQPLAIYSPRHPSLEIFDDIATYLESLS